MDALIENVDAERRKLVAYGCPSEKQSARFDKVVKYLNPTTSELPPTTKGRRNATRALLTSILSGVGHEVLLLCIFAIPGTRMSTIDSHEFIQALRTWWSRIDKFPVLVSSLSNIRIRIKELKLDCSQASSPAPRSSRSRATNLPETPALEAARVDKHHRVVASSLLNNADIFGEIQPSPSDIGHPLALPAQSHALEESFSAPDNALDEFVTEQNTRGSAHTASDEQTPLYYAVYKLDPMDAIQALSSDPADCAVRLTVPLVDGRQPFATFHVPLSLASAFMKRCEKMTDFSKEPERPQKVRAPG